MAMHKKFRKARGYSLIELMVVLVIIGIIASIAYPQYGQYVIRAGRADGAAALLEIMERQELFYRSNLRYTGNLTDLGYPGNIVSSEEGRYQISAGTCDSGSLRRCVELPAVAQAAQVSDGNLTLNSRGGQTGNWP